MSSYKAVRRNALSVQKHTVGGDERHLKPLEVAHGATAAAPSIAVVRLWVLGLDHDGAPLIVLTVL